MSYEDKRIYNKIVHSTFIGFTQLVRTKYIKMCCITKYHLLKI